MHINGRDPETENYLIQKNITYTKTDNNVGLCSGVNLRQKNLPQSLVIYSHDDVLFTKVDFYIFEEIKKLPNNLFIFLQHKLVTIQKIKVL